jgi:hypothetical protein
MKNRNLMILITGLACLVLAGLLVWSGGGIGQMIPYLARGDANSMQKPLSTRSSNADERVERERRKEECRAAMESAYQDFARTPRGTAAESEKAEMELIRAFAACAETDLGEVHDWMGRLELWHRLPKGRNWVGDVLKELAKTQPRKALEFGLGLNEADLESYAVPPRSLLGIALQHLTAEDAIRVMEMPKRDDSHYRITSQATSSEAYHPDFDFRKLGNYIVKKEHEGERFSWKPTAYPDDWVSSWTRRDPAGAEAFCRAMNDRPEGASLGDEFVDYFGELAKTQTQAEIVEKMMSVISDPSVEFSENNLAYLWIDEDDKRPILLDLAKRLPEATRNRMGEDALLMNVLSKTEDSPKILEAAMQLFATAEAREEAIANLGNRGDPELVSLLRTLEEVIDSR